MTLKNVLEEICAEEYALPEKAPRHRFSAKHRRVVNDILYSEKAKRRMSVKRRVLVIAAAAAVLAVITGAVSIIRHDGFWFKKDHIAGYDYFIMHAENDKNAPKTIEKHCHVVNLPERYKPLDELCHEYEDRSTIFYYDTETMKGYLVAHQITKESFENPIMLDCDEYAPIEINGCNGFSVVHTAELTDGGTLVNNQIIWDCGEYIHYLSGGTLPLEEIIAIAEGMTELT